MPMGNDTHFAILGATMQRQEQRVAHIVLSEDGVVEAWQPVMETLFGWTAEEAIGQLLAMVIIPPELRAVHQGGLARWREDAAVAVIACRRLSVNALHKDGHLVPVYVDAQIVRDDACVRFLGWVTPREDMARAAE